MGSVAIKSEPAYFPFHQGFPKSRSVARLFGIWEDGGWSGVKFAKLRILR